MSPQIAAHNISEEWLIQQAAQGDLEAFNQLVLRHQDRAFGHALALLGDQDAAMDAAQEGFIKAFEHIAEFRGGSFRAWLLKIITNAAYDTFRRSSRHPSQPLIPEDPYGEESDSAPWLVDPNPSTHETVEQRELANDIYRALGALPEPYRSVLTLVDLHEFDYAEAARALGIPIGTVKSRLARGRLQMQEMLRGVIAPRKSQTEQKPALMLC